MTKALRSLRWSLQTTLLIGIVVVTILAAGVGVWLMVSAAQLEARKLHDRKLAQVAELMLGLSDHEIAELGALDSLEASIQHARSDSDAAMGDDYRYQVWDRDGRPVLSNFGSASTMSPMGMLGGSGFGRVTMDGEPWRTFSLRSATGPYEIHVAERESLRAWGPTLVGNPFFAMLVPALLLVMLPALWLCRRLLKPLLDLAADLEERQPSNLDHVVVDRPPTELVPLVAALNRLLSRVSLALQREAEFTATAAHELRTPLANLRVLAEAAGHARTANEREHTLRQLVSCVDRCAHLQEQLLTLSRLDAIGSRAIDEQVELIDVVMEALGDLRAQARQGRVSVATRLDDSAIHGHRFGVLTLVRNLAANAIHHSPPGGRVEVSMEQRGGNVLLFVDDAGPGIPPQERERAFERFERLTSHVPAGTGLGLSIVRRVAVLHGATVTLEDSPLGGLRVVVEFRGPGAATAVQQPEGRALIESA